MGSPFGLFENLDSTVPLTPPEIVVFAIIWSLYEVCGRIWAALDSTPGKALFRIRLVRSLNGASLGWREAMNRWSVLAGGIGFLLLAKDRNSPWYAYAAVAASALAILVSEHRQGLHDRAAGSVVIRVQNWTWSGCWARMRGRGRRLSESCRRTRGAAATLFRSAHTRTCRLRIAARRGLRRQDSAAYGSSAG